MSEVRCCRTGLRGAGDERVTKARKGGCWEREGEEIITRLSSHHMLPQRFIADKLVIGERALLMCEKTSYLKIRSVRSKRIGDFSGHRKGRINRVGRIRKMK
jgi:hypothetical protein